MNIVDKILNNEELTVNEVESIVYDTDDFYADSRLISTETDIMDSNRWDLSCAILIKIYDKNKIRAYKVYYRKAATEYQEDQYWEQVAEEAFPTQIIQYMTKGEIEYYKGLSK